MLVRAKASSVGRDEANGSEGYWLGGNGMPGEDLFCRDVYGGRVGSPTKSDVC